MAEINEEILRNRQTWFWRRVTLQATLAVMLVILVKSVAVTSGLANDWPTASVQLGLLAAIAWLITMYFAMVDSADKAGKVIEEVGDAVGHARHGASG